MHASARTDEPRPAVGGDILPPDEVMDPPSGPLPPDHVLDPEPPVPERGPEVPNPLPEPSPGAAPGPASPERPLPDLPLEGISGG